MSGIANPNYVCYFQDTVLTAARAAEVPNADFVDTDGNGCNRAASNSPGIGINTGDYDPKVGDWPRAEVAGLGQNIGTDNGVNNRINAIPDGNDQVLFIQAVADVANDAQFALSGAFNRTGVTVPNGSWCWGHVPVV